MKKALIILLCKRESRNFKTKSFRWRNNTQMRKTNSRKRLQCTRIILRKLNKSWKNFLKMLTNHLQRKLKSRIKSSRTRQRKQKQCNSSSLFWMLLSDYQECVQNSTKLFETKQVMRSWKPQKRAVLKIFPH